MSKADEIFTAAFSKPRDPRSAEYRHGVLDALKVRLHEATEARGKYRYPLGTAQADAYFAGQEEGHRLADRLSRRDKSRPTGIGINPDLQEKIHD